MNAYLLRNWLKRVPVATFACALIILSFFGLYLRNVDYVVIGNRELRFTKEQLEMIAVFPICVSALCVILMRRYGPKDKYWAYATIGALIGFVLRLQSTT